VNLYVDAASDNLLNGSTAVGDIGCAVPEQGKELNDAENQGQHRRLDLFVKGEE
jgi:hypothetical protein